MKFSFEWNKPKFRNKSRAENHYFSLVRFSLIWESWEPLFVVLVLIRTYNVGAQSVILPCHKWYFHHFLPLYGCWDFVGPEHHQGKTSTKDQRAQPIYIVCFWFLVCPQPYHWRCPAGRALPSTLWGDALWPLRAAGPHILKTPVVLVLIPHTPTCSLSMRRNRWVAGLLRLTRLVRWSPQGFEDHFWWPVATPKISAALFAEWVQM